jgi:hypothetical protein
VIVQLTWRELDEPFCFALPAGMSAADRHHMPSLFVGCDSDMVTIKGRAVPGTPVPRDIAGRRISTAMLTFSEIWIQA